MWIFYDAFAGGRDGRKDTQGPMPCKRWRRDGKRHRLHYRSPKRIAAGPRSTDTQMERKAVEYARWLAKRDSVTLPGGRTCVIWAGVTNAAGKWEKRIRAVSFGTKEIPLPNWNWIPDANQSLQEAA